MNNPQEDLDKLFCFKEYQNGFNQGIDSRLSDLAVSIDKLKSDITTLHIIILIFTFIIIYQLL